MSHGSGGYLPQLTWAASTASITIHNLRVLYTIMRTSRGRYYEKL
ncbi:hypothetical protein HanXRQr2_Chr09g0407081 [Helianthus annuus]|uniref:Uncharacterized protein n=1 Tax=Helianthus annuus TaxID=4232 RepID=A0A9K3I923_HELAN|nr:hypothetical protein HanXRQr2_Chr09g0407081 [Helianthus annuus]KAJ0894790.1 hypothetical protein HanPSC8_Chr09g0392961 [Helianthus annuus]